jgi:hypothetical protein
VGYRTPSRDEIGFAIAVIIHQLVIGGSMVIGTADTEDREGRHTLSIIARSRQYFQAPDNNTSYIVKYYLVKNVTTVSNTTAY